ncbi:Programmed cell death 1 ligand 1 [Channa argus]|uniref:Programmed cell death 1 ligand 1 n=1 Tax=Channa argus TaxID=215402 RepID=A0A6G1Q711_CHAAH|nr:Programmed cell death 1 ligand 1 [Channa argus]
MMSALKRTIFVCLLACFLKCSVSEEEKNVKTGDNVILQCQGPRDADTVMLKWIRPDLKSDGYVLYFSDHQEQKQHQHFHGRVELIDPQMKDGDFSVILKNVNINDTGTYECRVGYKGSKPQTISTTKLTVITSGERVCVCVCVCVCVDQR